MRIRMLALALAAAAAAPALAEPVLPFAPFLVPNGSQPAMAAVAPRAATPSVGGDNRDKVDVRADRALRPEPRPARLALPLRTASAARRIVRMPWTTGVYQ